jgi:hypothetical protein
MQGQAGSILSCEKRFAAVKVEKVLNSQNVRRWSKYLISNFLPI